MRPFKVLLSIILLLSLSSSSFGQLADYSSIDKYATSLKFTKDYETVVDKITTQYDSEEEIARAIFTWIVTYIEYDNKVLEAFQESGKRGKTRFKGTKEEIKKQKLDLINSKLDKVLKSQKGVCQDYAWLFQAMCTSAGLEAEFISGYGRTNTSDIGKTYNRGNHAWNSVKIDGEWQLFDATWSTGKNPKGNQKLGYFMLTPEIFIHNHHPTDSTWQLLEEPVSKEAFGDLAFLYGDLLEYGLNEIDNRSVYLPAKEENTVRFKCSDKIDRVIIIDGKKQIPVETEYIDGYTIFKYKSKTGVPRAITITAAVNGQLVPLMTYKLKS